MQNIYVLPGQVLRKSLRDALWALKKQTGVKHAVPHRATRHNRTSDYRRNNGITKNAGGKYY